MVEPFINGEIIAKPKIQVDLIPCLICGQSVEAGERSKNDITDYEYPVKEEEAEGEKASVDKDLFRCLLKGCHVKLSKSLMIMKKYGDDKEEEFIPSFCSVCKEQLEILLQLQQKIRELEKALQKATVSVKEKMVEAEGFFNVQKIYDGNKKYFYIRRKILGHHCTGYSGAICKKGAEHKDRQEGLLLSSLPPMRRSSLRERTSGKPNYVKDNNITNISHADNQTLPLTIMINNSQACNESDEQISDRLVEDMVKQEMDLDSRDDFTDSDESYSPDHLSHTLSGFDSTESDSKEIEHNEESKDKIFRKALVKTSKCHKRSRKRQTENTFTNELSESLPKKKNIRKGKMGAKQVDNNDDTNAVKRHNRGSYNKAKVHLDPTTGNYQYLQVNFEKLAPDRYKCVECLEIVWNESTIKKHTIRSHTNTFVCDICGQHKASGSDLNKHKREVHQGRARKAPEKTMECPICGKPFGHKTALEFHKVTHYSEQDKLEASEKGESIPDYKDRIKSHQCGICGVIFNNITWLKKHEKTKHPKNEEEKFEMQRICPECGKSFSEAYFKQHMERYHSNLDVSKVKPYQCSVCDKRFYTTTSLVEHKRTHTGERPFKCKLCDKDFISKNRLKYHNMQNHENRKPFACTSCSAAFVTSYKLRRHVATVHEGKSQKDWNATKDKEKDWGAGEMENSHTRSVQNVASIMGTGRNDQSVGHTHGENSFYFFK